MTPSSAEGSAPPALLLPCVPCVAELEYFQNLSKAVQRAQNCWFLHFGLALLCANHALCIKTEPPLVVSEEKEGKRVAFYPGPIWLLSGSSVHNPPWVFMKKFLETYYDDCLLTTATPSLNTSCSKP